MRRWLAEITYRTDNGPLMVPHDLAEISDLQALVERGPHWDTIDLIQIFRVNHNTAEDLTVEAAAKL
jgi:hypothetical protein